MSQDHTEQRHFEVEALELSPDGKKTPVTLYLVASPDGTIHLIGSSSKPA